MSERVFLSPNQILERRPKIQEVELPGGSFVRLRGLSGQARDAFDAETVRFGGDLRNIPHWRAKIAQRSIVDESGKLVFNPKQIGELSEIDGADLDAIVLAVMTLSGMRSEEQKSEAGNSQAETGEDSSSASA